MTTEERWVCVDEAASHIGVNKVTGVSFAWDYSRIPSGSPTSSILTSGSQYPVSTHYRINSRPSATTSAGNARQVREEVEQLRRLAV